jgi:hypothetical protein
VAVGVLDRDLFSLRGVRMVFGRAGRGRRVLDRLPDREEPLSSLSLDNVFVFSVIFTTLAVPREYRYHVLFYGVSGPREADVGTGNKRDKQAERRRWRTCPMSPARSGWEDRSTRSGSTPAP